MVTLLPPLAVQPLAVVQAAPLLVVLVVLASEGWGCVEWRG